MPQALHHGCWYAFKQLYCLDANDDSCVDFVFGVESFTCGKMQRMSIWKMVLATLKAMSGRMLNKVRENSWTAVESMSAPTARGAKPDTHALKLDCIASKSWFRSSCSNPPKYPKSLRYLDHHHHNKHQSDFFPSWKKSSWMAASTIADKTVMAYSRNFPMCTEEVEEILSEKFNLV